MADKIEFSILGLEDVQRKMRGLVPKLRQKGAKSALGKAAALVRKKAKENALRVDDPETGRKISENIGQRLRGRYNRRTGNVMISVGVLTERGRIPKGNPDEGKKGNTPHWHLIEEGTEQAAAQPFLRPALSESIGQATDKFVTEFDKEIDKALAQL